jgi:hypothetical protein
MGAHMDGSPGLLGRFRDTATRREFAILGSILVVAAVLRLADLERNPPGLYCDEVALGVNARQLGRTGRSLKGEALPLYVHEATFEKWGSKAIVYQPIYQYAMVPVVGTLGLSAFSVRLTSVLFGLLGIVSAHFLARQLHGPRAGLAAAFLLALSPWHFQYSRIAFEVVSLTFFVATGFALLHRGLERPGWLLPGAVLLAAGTYCYPAARMFIPLLCAAFGWIFRDALARHRPSVLQAVAAAVLVGLPNLYLVLTDPNQSRMHHLFLWGASLDAEPAVRLLREGWSDTPAGAAILGNRDLLVPFSIAYNYLRYLSPDFLLLSGDPVLRHCPRGMGVCHWFVAPLLLAGLVALFRSRPDPRSRFLLAWMLLWPIPASLTVDSPHATRAFVAFPILEIVAALGLAALARAAGPARPARLRVAAAGLLVAVGIQGSHDVSRHLHDYFRRYPVYAAESWDFGVREAFAEAARLRRPDEEILVSPGVFNSYLNILFFADAGNSSPPGNRNPAAVPLPPGYRVAWTEELNPRPERALWIVKAREAHPSMKTVAEIPMPDGAPNLRILREGRTEDR